jgi:hypothetical protein
MGYKVRGRETLYFVSLFQVILYGSFPYLLISLACAAILQYNTSLE